ncbi:hypothetical protein G9C98_001471 [Cotesia typhae]|uniref:Dynein regulatory complex protein 10 n=1 Tax=Cotesia typhae TaxID=2053667 RepID=A0A8J5QWG7_9HYME|nr:hypothetical protein G9C98_001471 [Cotesia typhae]
MEREIAIARVNAILTELITQVKKISDASKRHQVSDNEEQCSGSENLIKMLNVLGRIIEMRMQTSPREERERASTLASALVNGEKARVEAENLESTIETEKLLHQHFTNDVKEQIAEEKILLEGIKARQKREIDERKQKTAAIIEEIWEKKSVEEKKLLREINFKSAEYEVIYAINQNNEENLYNMRRKAEQDYLEILSKYDKDVGMIYRTMESLIEESNILEIRLKILEDKVSIQKIEYEELKNEREMAISEAFAETLNNFKRNRAARIIQRGWRGYLEHQLLKKKKKSKKKK